MKLSVIVCTRNRAHAIRNCLVSIESALSNAAPVDAEIVVVDNASSDDTLAIIKEWAQSCKFPTQFLIEPKPGASRARNRGILAARGELLVFTDDDCCMDQDHIGAVLRHDSGDSALVIRGGRVELGDPTDIPLTIATSLTAKHISRKENYARHMHIGGVVGTANLSMRRGVIDRVGLFDKRLGPGSSIPAGEDTDLIYRAYLAGIDIEYVPDMVVFHYHGRKTPADGNRLLRNYLIGEGALYVRYIFKDYNLCRMFYWDVKNAIKEFVSGKNTFLPDYYFSHKDKIIYSLLGAFRYVLVLTARASSEK